MYTFIYIKHLIIIIISIILLKLDYTLQLMNVKYWPDGQEPPRGESTTTGRTVNYQLLAVVVV